MMYDIVFTSVALEDIEIHKRSGDKAILKKLSKLLKELRIHPTTGTGHPELLRYSKSGQWSRELSKKHRLVYRILAAEVVVEIISAEGHYGDK